jgi:hypothetical protein
MKIVIVYHALDVIEDYIKCFNYKLIVLKDFNLKLFSSSKHVYIFTNMWLTEEIRRTLE